MTRLKNWIKGNPKKSVAIALVVLLFVMLEIGSNASITTSSEPVVTQEGRSNNDAAFCAMVNQYLVIVNGDQVSVTDAMVIAGLQVIAEKAQGTRFEETANLALTQSKSSDAKGLLASLGKLAGQCNL